MFQVGGQPSGGYDTNFKDIAAACGYAWSERASTMEELEQVGLNSEMPAQELALTGSYPHERS